MAFTLEERIKLELTCVLLCKQCNRKILDPDKKQNQVFTKAICPYCYFNPSEKSKK